MVKEIPKEWGLNMEQVSQIYLVEKELAQKLRTADIKLRRTLYSSVYEEYFQRLPFHPQFTIKKNPSLTASRVNYQLHQILPFLKPDSQLAEVGAGDCSLSLAASSYCAKVFPLEVSQGIAENKYFPDNVELILFDGFNIPLPENSIDVTYSNQLMEHLHPDDALQQLASIYKILKKSGVYICITPNRISGPHDVSRFFADTSEGFHLREYSATDLKNVFAKAGFSRVIAYTVLKGKKIEFPFFIVSLVESIAELLPASVRSIFLKFILVRIIFNSVIAAVK